MLAWRERGFRRGAWLLAAAITTVQFVSAGSRGAVLGMLVAIAALGAMGIAKDAILHVAQSKHHDVVPGRRHGLATVWVNRRSGRPGFGATPEGGAVPDLEVADLATLARLATA